MRSTEVFRIFHENLMEVVHLTLKLGDLGLDTLDFHNLALHFLSYFTGKNVFSKTESS